MERPWIGVDLDGTLAYYKKFEGPGIIGEPIEKMVTRVKNWRQMGREIRIFTARVYPLGTAEAANLELAVRLQEAVTAHRAIEAWCLKHIGEVLPITCI